MSEEIRAQTYVGFDSITQQIEHKLLKRGFQFNVIVVGEFLYMCGTLGFFVLVPWRYFCVGGQSQGLPDGVVRVHWCQVLGFLVGAS